jgi:hypothetical protein
MTTPEDLPDYLRHRDDLVPVPTWQQVTRSAQGENVEMTARVSRIIANTDDQAEACALWDSWQGKDRRSAALLIDKIYYEGWLDAVGPIINIWEGGFFFTPRTGERGSLEEVLAAKAGRGGTYTESRWAEGLIAYLNSWNHAGWRRSFMENDSGMAALHVGIFDAGRAEAHLDTFNPLYTNGAPPSDVVEIPLIGAFNHRLLRLHRRWDQAEFAATVRTSANFYHLLRQQGVPLSF